MSNDFFIGLVAALRLSGVDFIETRDNVHHQQFEQVAKRLEQLVEAHAPGAEDLPGLFRPALATGLYGEWDDALLSMQHGFGSSPNPSYLGLKLQLTPAEADDVLHDFPPETRDVFAQLADVYRDSYSSARDRLTRVA